MNNNTPLTQAQAEKLAAKFLSIEPEYEVKVEQSHTYNFVLEIIPDGSLITSSSLLALLKAVPKGFACYVSTTRHKRGGFDVPTLYVYKRAKKPEVYSVWQDGVQIA